MNKITKCLKNKHNNCSVHFPNWTPVIKEWIMVM